jgi:hypothetical protein
MEQVRPFTRAHRNTEDAWPTNVSGERPSLPKQAKLPLVSERRRGGGLSPGSPRRAWSRHCQIARLTASAGLAVSAVVLFPSWAFAAGEEIWTAMYRMIGWLQGILLPLSVITFIVGIGFFLFDRQRGKNLMVAAVLGVILSFLAWPIMNLAVSFAR